MAEVMHNLVLATQFSCPYGLLHNPSSPLALLVEHVNAANVNTVSVLDHVAGDLRALDIHVSHGSVVFPSSFFQRASGLSNIKPGTLSALDVVDKAKHLSRFWPLPHQQRAEGAYWS